MIRDLLLFAALGVPSMAVVFATRARRTPLTTVTYLPVPPAPVVTDLRTPEQRAADQARFDRALPRGGAA